MEQQFMAMRQELQELKQQDWTFHCSSYKLPRASRGPGPAFPPAQEAKQAKDLELKAGSLLFATPHAVPPRTVVAGI